MLIKKLRLQKGWSQETLAELTGVSARTIQRIEKGYKPGLETSKALASVFEVDISTFTIEETHMSSPTSEKSIETINEQESEALTFVSGLKEFYDHLITYLVMVVVFCSLALLGEADDKASIIYLGSLGWGFGVLIHGLMAYEYLNLPFFSAKWERSIVEKRLKRKL